MRKFVISHPKLEFQPNPVEVFLEEKNQGCIVLRIRDSAGDEWDVFGLTQEGQGILYKYIDTSGNVIKVDEKERIVIVDEDPFE